MEISHVEAGSLGVVAFTGVQALIETANLKKGQKVLIIGASGGTGTFAVQLAKNVIGAYVAVTCSPRNAKLLSLLGADEVLFYFILLILIFIFIFIFIFIIIIIVLLFLRVYYYIW